MNRTPARPRVRPGENPFRSDRIDALPYHGPQGESVPQLAERFCDQKSRGALVGPHGHGKSTLMRELVAALAKRDAETSAVFQVASDLSNLKKLRGYLDQSQMCGALVAVDGYDLLPWWWRWVVWRQRLVLVTSHRPVRIPTLLLCETSSELLSDLINRLSPEVHTAMDAEDISYLYHAHEGNVRNTLRELYDRFADGEFMA